MLSVNDRVGTEVQKYVTVFTTNTAVITNSRS